MDLVTIRGADVRQRMIQGAVGMSVGSWLMLALVASLPAAAQVTTIQATTAHSSSDYTVNLGDDVSVTVTTDSSGTAGELATLINAAINADPMAYSLFTAELTASDTVTITAKRPGETYTVSASGTYSSDLSISDTTSADEADTVPFGRAVIATGLSDDGIEETGGLPKAAALTARVMNLAVVYAANEIYQASITVAGKTYNFNCPADTDSATTATRLAAIINDRMPAGVTVDATVDTANVILTAEIAGLWFEVTVSTSSTTETRLVLTTTTEGSDLFKLLRGVSAETYANQALVSGSSIGEYQANETVRVQAEGLIWVENSQTISQNDPVYIDVGATNAGKFYNSSGSNRILWPGARWVRPGRSSSGDIAQLSFPRVTV